jgi:hypothetical protein
MAASEEKSYATPEEASYADIPPEFVTVVGTRIDGDSATVWLLTSDQPPFEYYQVACVRQRGRWHVDSGFPSTTTLPTTYSSELVPLGGAGISRKDPREANVGEGRRAAVCSVSSK